MPFIEEKREILFGRPSPTASFIFDGQRLVAAARAERKMGLRPKLFIQCAT
jgi:hypothetical protein